MKIPGWVAVYVVDPLERAARTFVQQFVIMLPIGSGAVGLIASQSWLVALDSAGFAAIVSVLTSVLTFKVPPLPNWADVALRGVKTFLQSFIGTLTTANVLSVAHADWKGALAVAVPVAVTSLATANILRLPTGFGVAKDVPAQREVDQSVTVTAVDPASAPTPAA